MKSHKFYGVCASFILVAVFALAGTVGAAGLDSLVKQACTKCHSSKRICLNVGAKSEALWKVTVVNMVKKGATLPTDKIDATANYLNTLQPGAGKICE